MVQCVVTEIMQKSRKLVIYAKTCHKCNSSMISYVRAIHKQYLFCRTISMIACRVKMQ